MTIPSHPAQLTAEWLAAALQNAGTIEGGSVHDFTVEPVGIPGLFGQIVRVRPTYDVPERGPDSLIAKFPAADPVVHERALRQGVYDRELRFYRELASEADVHVPHYLGGDGDPQSGAYVLLLEDLTELRSTDETVGCTVADAKVVLREIARLHAQWWGRTSRNELAWLPDRGDQSAQRRTNYESNWQRFETGYGGRIPPIIAALGPVLGPCVNEINRRLALLRYV